MKAFINNFKIPENYSWKSSFVNGSDSFKAIFRGFA